MMKLLIFMIFVSVTVADEHWFVFDQHQFPGFYTPLFTISSSSSSSEAEQKNLSFSLSSYERSINIDISNGNADGTRKQHEQSIKLNIERADLLSNTFNHLIFVALRQRTKLETYVNCKLIDSYLLYSLNTIGGKEFEDSENELTIEKSEDSIKYFHSSSDDHYHHHVFEKFGCKHAGAQTVTNNNNKTTVIGRSLIRKMQHVIEKVQRRKQRARRNPNQQATLNVTPDSLTIVYKPQVIHSDGSGSTYKTIVKVAQMALQIHYYPFEHLFHIRLNNENRTQVILYADKATDLVQTNQTGSTQHATVLFLHITPAMISCYVNCELTDQEFILDSMYVQTMIRQMMERTNTGEQIDSQVMEYNRQSTLVLFNKSIEQVAANFFCTKLDKKHEELLPDKYALRKFANALDMLVNSLDGPIPYGSQTDPNSLSKSTGTAATPTGTTPNVAMATIHSINAYGSLIAPPSNTDATGILNEIVEYDKVCSNDQECHSTNTLMKCQQKRCACPTRYFWSPLVRRCIACKDISIGNRCFRLSNHKSTWYEANDFCQEETSNDDQPEYTMKLASNLNRTDIELLKRSLLNEDDGEQLDYFYWIGLTSQFDTRKLHQHPVRSKRRVPTTIFRWYDNGETAALNMVDIWCSQNDPNTQNSLNNNELCVSLTSCGLYADDCQRNYRFLCEAV